MAGLPEAMTPRAQWTPYCPRLMWIRGQAEENAAALVFVVPAGQRDGLNGRRLLSGWLLFRSSHEIVQRYAERAAQRGQIVHVLTTKKCVQFDNCRLCRAFFKYMK